MKRWMAWHADTVVTRCPLKRVAERCKAGISRVRVEC